MSRCLENLVQSEDDDKSDYEIIKDTAGVFFLGASAFVLRFDFFSRNTQAGSGSTSAAIYTIILALLQYPDVQAKAQQELDEIVGRDRLPDLCDEASLPYLSAVIKEAFRQEQFFSRVVHLIKFPQMETSSSHRCVAGYISRYLFSKSM